ncbi:DUF6701 domain-containing protein [Pseudoduganella sp. OTU4001]|uniref:DUF6701 domain-containing protein n=1 Tax=Pseudoduganella sp. OTU4001 TaxID=3043854 RepID=UPI00313D4D00
MIFRAILAIFLWCAATFAHAQTYSWPADLTKSDFNCNLIAAGEYNCPSMSFSKDEYIVITSPITVHVNGSFKAAKNFIIPQGSPLLLDVNGEVTFSKDMNAYMDIKSTGNMSFAKNTILHGDLNSTNGNITIAKDSLIDGDVFTKYQLKVGKNSSISGNCTYATTNYICSSSTPPPSSSFDHFLVEHEGTGLTCQSSEITIWACSGPSSGGTCTTTTNGVSGTLEVRNDSTNALVGSYNFTIPAGQTFATVLVPYDPAKVKFLKLGTTTAGTTCWDGDAASCQHTFFDAAFDFEVPDHVSGTSQPVTIAALQKTSTNSCAPAWTGTFPISFTCTYVDPNSAAPSGSLPVTLESGSNSVALTCGGAAKSLSILFDSTGKGPLKVTYPDAGRIELAATYQPKSMYGNSTFVAYPQKFAVTWPTPRPTTLVAGSPFNVNVTAMNGAETPVATPNFGRESTPAMAQMTFAKCKPTNGEPGLFSGTLSAFTAGVATSTDATWDEVGTGDITATTTTNYLTTGKTITGSSNTASGGACTGLFDRFRPHHFTTKAIAPTAFTSPAAPAPPVAWAYSGQPFTVEVSAFSATGSPTLNYYVQNADIFAREITFTGWSNATPSTANPGPGSMTVDKLAATAFTVASDGVATGNPAYAFTTPLTKPTTVIVRATDTDGTSSSGYTEASVEIRSGRVRISNAFGPRTRDLDVPVRVEYYTGNSWLLNLNDNQTVLPASAFALTAPNLMTGVSVLTGATMTAGTGTFRLKKPTNAANDNNGSGRINIAVNLGTATADASCWTTHPPSTGANMTWLRSLYGPCNTTYTQDPIGRATFGSTNPENRSTIYVREVFN